jgi:alanyl-tRNA synthetase
VEAVSGSVAYRRAVEQEELLRGMAARLKTTPENLPRRVEQLAEELRDSQRQLEKARQTGSTDIVGQLMQNARNVDGVRVIAAEVNVANNDELRKLGDRIRAGMGSAAAVLIAKLGDRVALFALVSDDLISKGVRADIIVKEIAAFTGGTGGGRPHMAQGGVGDASRIGDALERAPEIVRSLLGKA